MTSGRVKEMSTFVEFADATVETAKELYDEKAANVVRKAWDEVGVTEKKADDKDDDGDNDDGPSRCRPM